MFNELLEERFEAVTDRLGFHDRPADAFEVGQDGSQTLGELIGLIARFTHRERSFALLAVGHIRT